MPDFPSPCGEDGAKHRTRHVQMNAERPSVRSAVFPGVSGEGGLRGISAARMPSSGPASRPARSWASFLALVGQAVDADERLRRWAGTSLPARMIRHIRHDDRPEIGSVGAVGGEIARGDFLHGFELAVLAQMMRAQQVRRGPAAWMAFSAPIAISSFCAQTRSIWPCGMRGQEVLHDRQARSAFVVAVLRGDDLDVRIVRR